jgi:hypothetical protein
MSLTKLPLGRNNSVMMSLFPPRESLVVTSRLETGNSRTFFLWCNFGDVSITAWMYSCNWINTHTGKQCSGSGSVSFEASSIGIYYSEVRITNRILPSSSKNSKKNLYFYCFVTSLWLFNFEDDVNVPSKIRSKKRNKFFFVGVLKVTEERAKSGLVSPRYGSTDPDTYQNVTDPEYCRLVVQLWIQIQNLYVFPR